MRAVDFVVYGKPQPAGSKRAFVRGNRAVVVDANAAAKPWKQEVACVAIEAMAGEPPISGPVDVSIWVWRRRPINHLRADGTAKASAPIHPVARPDLLKIARGIEDALTGICYVDDAAIVTERLFKRWGTPERVAISVTEVAE